MIDGIVCERQLICSLYGSNYNIFCISYKFVCFRVWVEECGCWDTSLENNSFVVVCQCFVSEGCISVTPLM